MLQINRYYLLKSIINNINLLLGVNKSEKNASVVCGILPAVLKSCIFADHYVVTKIYRGQGFVGAACKDGAEAVL